MIRKIFMLAALACVCSAPVRAEYVMPLDMDGSDEQLRDDASSGFDTPGAFAIPEDDYYNGDNGDGTWTPDVPDVPEPTPVYDYYE